jgi:UDP-N-acetylglucosamine 2-epimerase
MKICTIIGARPQFIKAAAVSRAIAMHNKLASDAPRVSEVIIHTGQHYDDDMSAVFFRELEIPNPAYNLGIGSGGHGTQTGQMLAGIEDILLKEKPDWVLIYGDTNSTLAGALAASKLNIPIAHVEAGLRSFNRRMPEEINRVMTDHLSTLLFCPSQTAVDNLRAEGIPPDGLCLAPYSSRLTPNVFIVGDVMADAFRFAATKLSQKSDVLQRLKIEEKRYYLATIHRAENTDDQQRLYNIMNAFSKIAEKAIVILPLHPRTKKILGNKISMFNPALRIIDPVGYFDIVALQKSALMILTDSGGMQKEAYWSQVPCITLRDETEWVETIETGWNVLAGADYDRIIQAVVTIKPHMEQPPLYGDGHAAGKIIEALGVRS